MKRQEIALPAMVQVIRPKMARAILPKMLPEMGLRIAPGIVQVMGRVRRRRLRLSVWKYFNDHSLRHD
jgi:hypothetical protein